MNVAPLPFHSQNSPSVPDSVGLAGGRGRAGNVATVSAVTASTAAATTVTAGANSLVSGSSKFVPICSVRSIRDLSLEMKASSSTAKGIQFNSRALSSKFELLSEINSKLHPTADRNEFRKQMDMSRVIGKEVCAVCCDLCAVCLRRYYQLRSLNFPF